MALTPMDIHNKEFENKFRGYDQDQVNDFLQQVIKDYEIILNENKSLRENLSNADEKVKYFNDLKDSLNQSIVVAQEAADRVKKDAEADAQITIATARKNADEVVADAKTQAAGIIADAKAESQKLVNLHSELRDNLNQYKEQMLDLIEREREAITQENFATLNKVDKIISDNNLHRVEVDEFLNNSIDLTENEDQKNDEPIEVTEKVNEDVKSDMQEVKPADIATSIIFPETNPQKD